LVYGENEAGKTTVQWFIRGMLYSLKGGKNTKGGAIPPLKNTVHGKEISTEEALFILLTAELLLPWKEILTIIR